MVEEQARKILGGVNPNEGEMAGKSWLISFLRCLQ